MVDKQSENVESNKESEYYYKPKENEYTKYTKKEDPSLISFFTNKFVSIFDVTQWNLTYLFGNILVLLLGVGLSIFLTYAQQVENNKMDKMLEENTANQYAWTHNADYNKFIVEGKEYILGETTLEEFYKQSGWEFDIRKDANIIDMDEKTIDASFDFAVKNLGADSEDRIEIIRLTNNKYENIRLLVAVNKGGWYSRHDDKMPIIGVSACLLNESSTTGDVGLLEFTFPGVNITLGESTYADVIKNCGKPNDTESAVFVYNAPERAPYTMEIGNHNRQYPVSDEKINNMKLFIYENGSSQDDRIKELNEQFK